MIKLSERLKRVASYIPEDSTLADIGSDHAYLPIYAMQNGLIKEAIAGEVAEGPYNAAKASVEAAGYDKQIDVRKGDGLSVIKNGEKIDCITIAGMGGALISSILEQGKNQLTTANVKRLILQPNISANTIRKWFLNNGWELINESILEEDGHIYEILIAERGEPTNPYNKKDMEKEILFGPFLLKEDQAFPFIKKWSREYNEWLRVYEQLAKASVSDGITKKKEEIKQFIEWYEEVYPNENSKRI
ncbi:tRNA (adenine(22)-N(1))-methyltransferase [Bacillus andreraoultii]|uniref:tRNA (adenine(22)-N(1))-methyltransferase n=1 Tax=Bacillus andreraoultii TaxID=1499685 RepID=UPI00053B865D|nr:tRNA (adenine(22)-N(1))-methyltransferase TrmK [Bacillus andreraoultii]